MMMMRILLYVDGSRYSQWALQVALVLIAHFQTAVTLLTPGRDAGVDPDWLAEARQQLMAATQGTLREASQPGSAEEAIMVEADAHAYDLILLAPAGRSGLRRLLHGSRVAQVVRTSETSVLVAREPLTAIQRMLVSVGGDRRSLQMVEAAAQWARALGAKTTILHIVSQLPLFFTGLDAEEGHQTDAQMLAMEPEAQEVLQEARRILEEAGVFDRLLLREGLVDEQVLKALDTEDIELLVLGAHASAGVNRLLIDDLCDRLVQRSPVTTLVVRQT